MAPNYNPEKAKKSKILRKSRNKAKKMTLVLLPPKPSQIHNSPPPLRRRIKPYRTPVISAVSGKQLVTSGEVRAVEPKEAKTVMALEGYLLLDVRPIWELEKARVKESLHVPLFVEDVDNGPITLLKKWIHLGYIGLWTGQRFTMFNDEFTLRVLEAIPDKQSKILVVCGEGLRSLMAISKLYSEGYKSLGWLTGGFNRATVGDFTEIEGTEELRFATIGGASYYLLKLLLLLQNFGKLTN